MKKNLKNKISQFQIIKFEITCDLIRCPQHYYIVDKNLFLILKY